MLVVDICKGSSCDSDRKDVGHIEEGRHDEAKEEIGDIAGLEHDHEKQSETDSREHASRNLESVDQPLGEGVDENLDGALESEGSEEDHQGYDACLDEDGKGDDAVEASDIGVLGIFVAFMGDRDIHGIEDDSDPLRKKRKGKR